MKILIASDSFKGSLSSMEVADLLEKGILTTYEDAKIIKIPMADGGEGTLDTILSSIEGEKISLKVKDPLGNLISASYGLIDKKTAIVEMAQASGITLLSGKKRNPLLTTTYGTGQLIRDALDKGASKIYIGLGGSATNDGGVGMAQALGISFKDINGDEVGYGGRNLINIDTIDTSNIHPGLVNAEIIGISDVNNILCGENGASYVFGPQKGGSREDIELLDKNLFHLSEMIKKHMGQDISNIKGAGAAGGLGGGVLAFLNGRLESGVERILDIINFNEIVGDVDLVITGEGKMDSQTKYGKVPSGVAKRSKLFHKKVIAVAGSIGDDIDDLYDLGIDIILGIIDKPMTIDFAIKNAEELVFKTGKNIGRMIKQMRI